MKWNVLMEKCTIVLVVTPTEFPFNQIVCLTVQTLHAAIFIDTWLYTCMNVHASHALIDSSRQWFS